MPRQVLLFIIVSPDSFNDFMEQLNINLPIIGDLHAFLHTNESCSDEEKSKPQVLFLLCCANVSQLQFSKALIFPSLFSLFSEALHLREKRCHQLPPHLIQLLLFLLFSPLTWLNSFKCMACCNDLVPVVSLSILFFVYWDTRIYSFCIAMLWFTFLLSLLRFLNFSWLVIQPFAIQPCACAVYFVCLM